jgi:hypothetical protein
MLFVRSYRLDLVDVTGVTHRRVVAKRLDSLNSRAIRPIPGARLRWIVDIGSSRLRRDRARK